MQVSAGYEDGDLKSGKPEGDWPPTEKPVDYQSEVNLMVLRRGDIASRESLVVSETFLFIRSRGGGAPGL